MQKTNQDIAKMLYEMAELFEMNDVPFKPRAFEKAARSVEVFGDSISDLYKQNGKLELRKISGVGKGIADRIVEYIDTNRIREYEKMKKKIPINVSELSSIEGVGPKMIRELYTELKIKNLSDLERAAKDGKLQTLPGFGKKLEAKILKGIEFQKTSSGRIPLGEALPLARSIIVRLEEKKLAEKIILAGSCARWKETVGDIDIIAVSSRPREIMNFFASLQEVKDVLIKGDTKTSVRLKIGIDADIRVVPKKSLGATIQYFVGNKSHNIALRTIAEKIGYKLNEYGLFKGTKQIAGDNEKDIYKMLGLDWIPWEMRGNTGEIDLAKKHKLPNLVGYDDVRGDLQTQTDWTDGEHSIEDMTREAERLGREYIAITDHTKALAMTGGSDEKKLERQIKEIKKLNNKLQKEGAKIKILSGAEVNILKDGSLDIDDKTLAKLDIVGVAVHSLFNMPEKEQTARIIRAIENPNVDILFHPTGRIINKRPPYAVDLNEIFKVASRTGTILEIDAHPWRLDLKDEHIKLAKEYCCKFVIDTDAHSIGELSYIEYGIGQARRAGLEKKNIINTLPLKGLLSKLK
ncbi:MAG: DNA polymerase/3'-5' exonuclease PolX [Patescibacteria group bacterium]